MKSYIVKGNRMYETRQGYVSGGELPLIRGLREGFRIQLQADIDYQGDFRTPNPHSFLKDVFSGVFGSISTFPTSGMWSVQSGCVFAAGTHSVMPAKVDTYLYNETLSKINEKVRGSLDLSVDAAQLHMTKKMVKSAFKVVDFARDLRRNFGAAIAGKWLEYQYGWLPSVGSVYDAFAELTERGIARNLRVTFIARSQLTVSQSHPLAGYPGFNQEVTNHRHEMKLVLKNGVPSGVANYTSLNPFSIVWELLPYSFVVDWFYNVGSYLRNLETAMIYGNSFHSGYHTYGYLSNQLVRVWGRSDSTFYDATGNYRRTYKNRKVLSSYPFPRRPVLNTFSLGSGRLLNAAALLAVLLRK